MKLMKRIRSLIKHYEIVKNKDEGFWEEELYHALVELFLYTWGEDVLEATDETEILDDESVYHF